MRYEVRKKPLLFFWLLCMSIMLGIFSLQAYAESETRWADAADEIDKYVDEAFEDYLAGDATAAYNAVNNAYFKVYETTGMERQTMSYISGPRKNAVELQYSTCKGAVKKDNSDIEVQKEVRTALMKLKTMIREDANKLAEKDGEASSEMKFYLNGELVDYDPYEDLAGDPNEKVHYANWEAAAEAINELLDTSFLGYKGKDFVSALDNLNTAFYSVYEDSGLDHEIYSELSIEDREDVDNRFSEAKAMASDTEKFQRKTFQRMIRELKNVITAKAQRIDEAEAAETETVETEAAEETETTSTTSPSMATFLAALLMIIREGLEAILVVAAIIAYLVKGGYGKKNLHGVYAGCILGIICSFIMAGILYYAKQMWAGAGQSQELIEGITALIAVVVLFYVSNWMISKSEAATWTKYIDSKVQTSVTTGSVFSLSFAAFLAVFREGAELVLFYQPMLNEGHANMVWAGLGVGCIVLVFVYLAITKLSIKLPIKLFFTASSIVMAIMCVSFIGAGVKELAEGGVIDVSMNVPFIPDSEALQIFGIYPYLETLIPQVILAVILIVTFLMAHYRNKLAVKDLEIQKLKKEEAK